MTFFQRYFKWGWLRNAIPIFILAGFAILFFSDVLFQHKIFIHRDLSRFFYPLREFSVNEWHAGRIPLWNPYIHCGNPHMAELQTCVLYPLSIIYSFFLYPYAFNYFIVFHVFLAGLGVYLLMREWECSYLSSLFAAISFMFSGYMVSIINLLASLASVAWFPFVLLFYERACKKGWLRNSIITGIFLTLMFLGGEPSILYATVFILMLLTFSVLDCASKVGSEVRSNSISVGIVRRFVPLVFSLIIAAGLSSFQIFPFLEFLKESSRAGMDFKEASMWSLPPYALLDLFVPFLSEMDYIYKDYWMRQSWLLIYYMGIVSVICAYISLKFDITKRRKVIFYILVLGLLVSFGRYTPLYYFLYKAMPGFKLTRYPVKFFFIAAFSIAVLGGMGFEYYKKNITANSSLKRYARNILIFGFIASFFYLALNFRPSFDRIFSFLMNRILGTFPVYLHSQADLEHMLFTALYNIQRICAFFMFISVIIFSASLKHAKVNLIFPLLIGVSIIDIITGNKNVYQNGTIEEEVRPPQNAAFLMKDTTLFRVFNSPATLHHNMFVPERDYFEGMEGLRERMASNIPMSFGIYDAYGYGSLYHKRHEKIIDAIVKSKSPDETNLLNLLNVKYVISTKDFQVQGYNIVTRSKKVNVYENSHVLPRAFLAEKAVYIKDEAQILAQLKNKEFDPLKEVILEEEVNPKNTQKASQDRMEFAEIVRYLPQKVIVAAYVHEGKFLVLSDLFYPGWHVYIDGNPDKIYRADYILRALYLTPGKHTVTFIYRPFSFIIGLVISAVTCVAVVRAWRRA